MMKKALAAIPILLLLSYSAYSQEYSYTHYDVKDGLAGPTVYSMAQDKDGFIWFGTETGLSRFDGTSFTNYTTDDGLPDNEILKIFVDSKNRVWLMPFRNSIGYYWHGKFYNKKNDPVLASMRFVGAPCAMAEDSSGNMVTIERARAHLINAGGRIKEIDSTFGEKAMTFAMAGVSRRQDFILTFSSRKKYYFAKLAGTRFIPVIGLVDAGMNNPLTLYIGSDGSYYQSKDSLIVLDPENRRVASLLLPDNLTAVSHVNDSILAINTTRYSCLYNVRQKKVVDTFLKGRPVNGVMEDSEGSIWFSSPGQGVYRMGSTDVRYNSFRRQEDNQPVSCIRKFDSGIYLGGEYFFFCRLNSQREVTNIRRIHQARATGGRITSMISWDRNKLLLGSDVGIFLFRDFTHDPTIITYNVSIKSMSNPDTSLLLYASHSGVWNLPLAAPATPLNAVWMGRATSVVKDRNGVYYFGTLNGLYRTTGKSPAIFLGDSDEVFANRISALELADDGTLWVASDGGGVIGYRDGNVIRHITTADGLTSNICRNLFISGNNIWIGTDKGLNKVTFSQSGLTVLPYTHSDGLSTDMINAVFVDGDEVYVGTSEGLNFFDERKISKKSQCLLHINEISVSDRPWPGDTSGFVLQHADNNIQFDFIGISFKSGGNILYRYKLEGLDTAWRTTRENTLSYPSLPSGEYKMKIVAINKFGVRSKELSISFSIARLLWEKNWFRIFMVLAIAGLVWLFFQFRIRRFRKKEMERSRTVTKMAELEQMALRSQMNPHFIFNCLNSIQEYVIDKDIRGANEFITRFSSLIRQTLDFSVRSHISLEEEIQYISVYLELENKRFRNKFVSEVSVEEGIPVHHYQIPPMIIQPYVENAIRHGIGHRQDNKGVITISMKSLLGYLVCIITDNGVGRKLAARYKGANSITYQSRGMDLVARRVEMLNTTGKIPVLIEVEDLEDEQGAALGTRVSLRFPIEEMEFI